MRKVDLFCHIEGARSLCHRQGNLTVSLRCYADSPPGKCASEHEIYISIHNGVSGEERAIFITE